LAGDEQEYFNTDGDMEGHWSEWARPTMWTTSASRNIETKEFNNLLNKCMSLLPEKWASVFRLKFMEDEETENICKEMNLTPSNYWVIMHRAKLQLRKCMEVNWLGIKK